MPTSTLSSMAGFTYEEDAARYYAEHISHAVMRGGYVFGPDGARLARGWRAYGQRLLNEKCLLWQSGVVVIAPPVAIEPDLPVQTEQAPAVESQTIPTCYETMEDAARAYAADSGSRCRGGWIFDVTGSRLARGWSAYTRMLVKNGAIVQTSKGWRALLGDDLRLAQDNVTHLWDREEKRSACGLPEEAAISMADQMQEVTCPTCRRAATPFEPATRPDSSDPPTRPDDPNEVVHLYPVTPIRVAEHRLTPKASSCVPLLANAEDRQIARAVLSELMTNGVV